MKTTNHSSTPPWYLPPLWEYRRAMSMKGNSSENASFATNTLLSGGHQVKEKSDQLLQDSIVDRLLRHDKKAFEELYEDYSAAIYGLAFKILKEEALAEDALQETFVRIWRKIQTYDPSKGRLFTWMLNIVRNIAIDMLRARESRKVTQTSSIHQFSFDSKGPSAAMQVEHIGLREIVDGLPPDQKLVIELIYFLGYTQSEVAEEYDIPLGTVKSRVRLAMNHLRAKIG
jgi:RNA polymerase sigma factor (sigma-70 family)